MLAWAQIVIGAALLFATIAYTIASFNVAAVMRRDFLFRTHPLPSIVIQKAQYGQNPPLQIITLRITVRNAPLLLTAYELRSFHDDKGIPLITHHDFLAYHPIALDEQFDVVKRFDDLFPKKIDVDLEYYDLSESVRYLTTYTGDNSVATWITEGPGFRRWWRQINAFLEDNLPK